MGSLRLLPRSTGRMERLRAQSVSVRQYAEKKNQLLVVRGTGGLGDILMHRMLFEDFKLLLPDRNNFCNATQLLAGCSGSSIRRSFG